MSKDSAIGRGIGERAVEIAATLVLSSDDEKNGWDVMKLATYLAEREAQQLAHVMDMKQSRPVVVENVKSFDPFGWQ